MYSVWMRTAFSSVGYSSGGVCLSLLFFTLMSMAGKAMSRRREVDASMEPNNRLSV